MTAGCAQALAVAIADHVTNTNVRERFRRLRRAFMTTPALLGSTTQGVDVAASQSTRAQRSVPRSAVGNRDPSKEGDAPVCASRGFRTIPRLPVYLAPILVVGNRYGV